MHLFEIVNNIVIEVYALLVYFPLCMVGDFIVKPTNFDDFI